MSAAFAEGRDEVKASEFDDAEASTTKQTSPKGVSAEFADAGVDTTYDTVDSNSKCEVTGDDDGPSAASISKTDGSNDEISNSIDDTSGEGPVNEDGKSDGSNTRERAAQATNLTVETGHLLDPVAELKNSISESQLSACSNASSNIFADTLKSPTSLELLASSEEPEVISPLLSSPFDILLQFYKRF